MRFTWVLSVLLAGCFAPHIKPGQYKCDQTNLCPEGFDCIEGACYPPGTVVSTLFTGTLGDLNLAGMSGTLKLDASGSIVLGDTTIVPAGTMGWSSVPQSGGPTASLWRFANIVIPAQVDVVPSSASSTATTAFVLAASGTVEIDGNLNWSGRGPFGGRPSMDGQSDVPGVLGAGHGAPATTSGSGGGGAGYALAGSAGAGTEGGAPGGQYGAETVSPLHLGAGGGGGGGFATSGAQGGVGGNGGGAIAIFSQVSISLTSTIDVSGSTGQPGQSGSSAPAGGGGGGSGGSILLSAPSVTLAAGHALNASGGDGGPPAQSGGKGGAASVGRVWIGTNTLTTPGGAPNSMPAAVVSMGSLVQDFPR